MTGKQLVGVLALIVFATAVLPPVSAWGVNRARVERALRVLETLARTADPAALEVLAERGVWCGPGRLPVAAEPSVRQWMAAGRRDLATVIDVIPLGPDPWGNCYLALPSGWLLSAGPNGLVDTPIRGASAAGDDLAAQIP